jgi:alkaline phosphatase D
MLGETQWKWLEDQLTASDADVHIIGGGIQFLPEEHRSEKWANFPAAANGSWIC